MRHYNESTAQMQWSTYRCQCAVENRPRSIVVVGANHAGEFMRRYSPLITTILFKLYDTKALGDV